MKTLWNCGNYGNELRITRTDAAKCSLSGDNEPALKELMQKRYIKKQLKTLNPDKLKKELKEYGAWDSEQLENHEENLLRWLWISCVDITENN